MPSNQYLKYKDYIKSYYEKHKERISQQQKEYYKRNKEYFAERNRNNYLNKISRTKPHVMVRKYIKKNIENIEFNIRRENIIIYFD